MSDGEKRRNQFSDYRQGWKVTREYICPVCKARFSDERSKADHCYFCLKENRERLAAQQEGKPDAE